MVLPFFIYITEKTIGSLNPDKIDIFTSIFFEPAILIFSLNFALSTIMLAYVISQDGVSLRIIYWFYSFVFMGLAPVIQGAAGISSGMALNIVTS